MIAFLSVCLSVLEEIKMSGAAKKIVKYSQFQLKILKLYADFIRLSHDRPGLLDKVRQEFRQASKLNPRQDSLLIDYKLRRSANQLEMLRTSRVKAIKVVDIKKDQ